MGKQKRNHKVIKRPAWARFLAVYVVIEGFELGPEAQAVRAELNQKAPHAYTRATRLGSIWSRLTPETHRALEAAWQREKEGAEIPAARRKVS